jgi:hypothetical protein
VIDDGAAITVERLIGSIRREYLDHVVMFARIRACGADAVEYYAGNARVKERRDAVREDTDLLPSTPAFRAKFPALPIQLWGGVGRRSPWMIGPDQ